MSILTEIVEDVRRRIEKEKEPSSSNDDTRNYDRRSLKRSIIDFPGVSVIGELKKASPSAGRIRSEFEIEELADLLSGGGARAISVLTEPNFFDGGLEYLSIVRAKVDIPILRKDFIVDEYQLHRSAAMGADAVLLIAEVLGEELERYVKLAHRLGLETLVEAADEEHVKLAEISGTDLIGINNRDLNTMKVDLERTKKLVEFTSEDSIVVSESGIETREDVERVLGWGADAVLVGTALMSSCDVQGKTKELVYGDVYGKD